MPVSYGLVLWVFERGFLILAALPNFRLVCAYFWFVLFSNSLSLGYPNPYPWGILIPIPGVTNQLTHGIVRHVPPLLLHVALMKWSDNFFILFTKLGWYFNLECLPLWIGFKAPLTTQVFFFPLELFIHLPHVCVCTAMNWATMYVVTITSILEEKNNIIREQQLLICVQIRARLSGKNLGTSWPLSFQT